MKKRTKADPANRRTSGKRGTRRDPPTNAFKPGESGNPAGRPKDDPELVEAFRARTPKALAVLDKVLDGYINPPEGQKGPLAKDAVAASAVVLDRGWGKAPATIKLDANVKADMKAEVKHGVEPAVAPSPERLGRIAHLLITAGVIRLPESNAGDAGGQGAGDGDANRAGGEGGGAGEPA